MRRSSRTRSSRSPTTRCEIPPFSDKKGKLLVKNITGITFKSEQQSYLVGCLSALMAKKGGGNTISATGGVKIPPVDSFIAGYKAGAAKCVPGTKVLVGYSQDFIAQDKCKAVAQNQIAAGSKVVFAVAGPCGFGALAAAKEAGVWGDGVDVDQSYLGPHILTSAVKRVDLGVFRFVQAVKDGTLVPGHDFVFDLKNGGVALGKISPKVPACLQGKDRRAPEPDHRRQDQDPDDLLGGRARSSRRRAGRKARLSVVTESPRQWTEPPVLELRGITKQFPGVLANDHVDLDVAAGEVHALLGENGAGKSTLMNILYGLYHPDSGEILLNGKKTSFASAKDAIESGIGMVHQHFMLIPVMTVAENIVLAEEPTYAGVMLDFGEARKRVRELSDRYGLAVDPDAPHPGHHRRRAAARRDPEGPLPRGGDPRARRADRRPDAAGGEGAVRDHRRAEGAGEVDHLHLAQAARGARGRRPDHRPAPRKEDRDGSGARARPRRASPA